MMNKVKQMLPGGTTHSNTHTTSATPAYGVAGQHHHEMGMMDKVKEQLPGGTHSTTHTTTAAPVYGYRKKGMMDKVKEKLPFGTQKKTTHTTMGTKPGHHGTATRVHQEKGIMGKIKAKLPGGHSTIR
jgi:plastocyanin